MSWRKLSACSRRRVTAPTGSASTPQSCGGLGYYTGPVFEAELTFEILDEKGRPRQFGSVAGGGRYDDLVKRFTGQAVPATGISIGVDRLLAALRAKGRVVADTTGPVVVTVMDRERMGDYLSMASDLAGGGNPRRGLSGQPEEFRQPIEIRRQTAKPDRGDPGQRRGGAGTWC